MPIFNKFWGSKPICSRNKREQKVTKNRLNLKVQTTQRIHILPYSDKIFSTSRKCMYNDFLNYKKGIACL